VVVNLHFTGLEILTAVTMNSSIFLDMTPYSPLKVSGSFGATYRLHLQVQKANKARIQHEAGSK
jgi:hypothetical protein